MNDRQGRVGRRVGAFIALATLASCGGGKATVHDAGVDSGADASAPSADGPAAADGPATCVPADAGEPAVLPGPILYDGGVPIDRLAFDTALARCSYLARCFSLAPYVAEECVVQMSRGTPWDFSRTCTASGGATTCVASTLSTTYPSQALVEAIANGQISYDPQREGACLKALQSESCVARELFEGLPPCLEVFSCISGGRDARVPDGGAGDGGAACSAIFPSGTELVPCTTDDDCTAAGTQPPSGPHCAGGYCFADSCGDFQSVACSELVGAGEACDSNPPSPSGFDEEQHSRFCAPGLVCQGLSGGDGGVGTCAAPQDIGGPCAEGAQITGCLSGLACECGVCRLPPSAGPCVAGLCEVGVAYCDLTANLCRPLVQIAGPCNGEIKPCAPGLQCDSTSNTCQPM